MDVGGVSESQTITAFIDFARPGIDAARGVLLANAGREPTRFDIDRSGFTVLRVPGDGTNFRDAGKIVSYYYPEVEGLLRAAFGASSAIAFDHVFRKTGHSSVEVFPVFGQEFRREAFRRPVRRIEGGETEASAHTLLRHALGRQADALLRRRVMLVTVWRPIGTARRLAVCDAGSVAYHNIAAAAASGVGDRDHHVRPALCFAPTQRWLHFPELQSDEIVVMKDYDSAADGRATRCFRVAIEGEPAIMDASIEVRVVVVFPEGRA